MQTEVKIILSEFPGHYKTGKPSQKHMHIAGPQTSSIGDGHIYNNIIHRLTVYHKVMDAKQHQDHLWKRADLKNPSDQTITPLTWTSKLVHGETYGLTLDLSKLLFYTQRSVNTMS